jgi:hypothetical protein
MKMREEHGIDLAERNPELEKPHRDAASGVDQELLLSCLD